MLYHRDIVKAAGAFIARDTYRPALQGLHIKGGMVEASDGHVAVRFHPNGAPPVEEFPALPGVKALPADRAVILSPDAFKQAATSTPKGRFAQTLPILSYIMVAEGPAAGKVTLAATDLDHSHVGHHQIIDSVFPSLEAVMPKAAPTLRIAFNVELLARAFAALAKVAQSGEAPMVVLEFHGAEKGMRFELQTDHGKADGMIMPLRLPEAPKPQPKPFSERVTTTTPAEDPRPIGQRT